MTEEQARPQRPDDVTALVFAENAAEHLNVGDMRVELAFNGQEPYTHQLKIIDQAPDEHGVLHDVIIGVVDVDKVFFARRRHFEDFPFYLKFSSEDAGTVGVSAWDDTNRWFRQWKDRNYA